MVHPRQELQRCRGMQHCMQWQDRPAAPLLLGTLRFEHFVLPLRPYFPPPRPAEMELTEELQAEEHEVFYTDDFAMHDVAAGGRVAICMGCGADVGWVLLLVCPGAVASSIIALKQICCTCWAHDAPHCERAL